MPQMAPMSWLILFITFSLTYLIFYMINFYIIMYNDKKTINKSEIKTISWKW